MAVELVLGEDIEITFGGLAGIEIDGDIELNIEKTEIEKKLRNSAVVQHIISRRVNATGSFDGVTKGDKSIWDSILAMFIGSSTKIGKDTKISNIAKQPSVSIQFNEVNKKKVWKLGDVKIKSLKVSFPEDDVVKISCDYGANEIG
ncbi:MAG TPA: hypothetical protein PK411_14350 [Mesotoga infera]|nr:hypothetical protein [Mesotoga infera]HRV02396.1 hypothetical protein [Mesotoga sp.]